MSIEGILAEEASYQARRFQSQVAALESELREIEQRKREVEAKCKALRSMPERLFNYRARIDGNFQCPRCWIEHEKRSTLVPVGSNTRDDILRCHTCGLDVTIPGR
jgi:hypothetical protein